MKQSTSQPGIPAREKSFWALLLTQLSSLSICAGALWLTAVATAQETPRGRRAVNPAMAPITDTPGLPRVLLIGDSISIGYTLPVRQALQGTANVHRPNTNCGPTSNGVKSLDEWLGQGRWDVIHFNWGLHDLKYMGPDGSNLAEPGDPKNHQQVPPAEYAANLRQLVARLKRTGAKLIWRNTTPIPNGSAGRVVADAEKYNAIAAEIMREEQIPIHDLYAFVLPKQAEIMLPANVHFTPDGYQQLGQDVARVITAALAEANPTQTTPAPTTPTQSAQPRKAATPKAAASRAARTAAAADSAEPPSYDSSVPAPTQANVSYGPHPRNVLDFWQAPSDKPTPLVFVIHGGGWQNGEKERVQRFADVATLLKAGISVAAINYRLIKHAEAEGITPPVNAPLHDAARALQFVRSKATQWNIDSQRIGAAGGSAGACSSLWLAFHDDLADPDNSDPVLRQSTRLWCAAVTGAQTTLDPQQMKDWTPNSRYGGHAFGVANFADFLAQRQQLLPWIAEYSPYALVSPDDPPVFLSYSTPPALGQEQRDPTHTSNFGVKLQERCLAQGVGCDLFYPDSPSTAHANPTDYLIATLKRHPNYGNPPVARPPYYRIRYAGSDKPGDLVYPVAYTLWLPSDVDRLRGLIVHQHGCGEGSCKSGQTGAFDVHWQTLASQHQCALLAPSYEQPQEADCQLWCDPRHGSDARFQQALHDLGQLTGHAELASVPWALWGHSGGGHWAGGMLLLHPERVAAVWLRSGVPLFTELDGRNIRPHALPPAATEVPVMCNLGTKEGFTASEGKFGGVWPSNQAFFAKLRGAGGLVGLAIDPLTAHECGNQRYLAIPWLDACLSARLPQAANEPLRPMDAALSWLAPLPTPTTPVTEPVAAAAYQGDPTAALWLPNQQVALLWHSYILDTQIEDKTPPPAPTQLQITELADRYELTWQAQADLESGLSHFIIERNGEEVANLAGPSHRFGRSLFQGLQYSDTPATPLSHMQYQFHSETPVDVKQFRVRSVNTRGLMSP